jgi:hypothetical protein
MKWEPVEVINNIVAGKSDDLFIATTSFEPRCVNVSSKLHKDYRTKASLLLQFKGGTGETSKTTHTRLIEDYLKPHVITLQPRKLVDRHDPLALARILSEILSENSQSPHITCDVSTFTTPYFLMLLRYLASTQCNVTLRLLFTHQKLSERFVSSWGIFDNITLPFLGEPSLIGERNIILIMFLGRDKDRAWSVWRSVEPKVSVLVGTTSYESRIKKCPEFGLNKHLVEVSGAILEKAEDLSITDNLEILERYWNDSRFSDDVFVIAPLGYKSQALALFLFVAKQGIHPRIITTYAAPLLYAEPPPYNPISYQLVIKLGRLSGGLSMEPLLIS